MRRMSELRWLLQMSRDANSRVDKGTRQREALHGEEPQHSGDEREARERAEMSPRWFDLHGTAGKRHAMREYTSVQREVE